MFKSIFTVLILVLLNFNIFLMFTEKKATVFQGLAFVDATFLLVAYVYIVIN